MLTCLVILSHQSIHSPLDTVSLARRDAREKRSANPRRPRSSGTFVFFASSISFNSFTYFSLRTLLFNGLFTTAFVSNASALFLSLWGCIPQSPKSRNTMNSGSCSPDIFPTSPLVTHHSPLTLVFATLPKNGGGGGLTVVQIPGEGIRPWRVRRAGRLEGLPKEVVCSRYLWPGDEDSTFASAGRQSAIL